MKLIPKKTFLLRQEGEGKIKKDVVAHRGVAIEVTDAESVKFYGYFDFENEKTGEADKKKVMKAARDNKSLLRTV
jgi:hypothetical protein